MKELAIQDDDDDDEDDSEYEYMGGDLSLYESRMDDFDELLNLQQALLTLEQSNNTQY